MRGRSGHDKALPQSGHISALAGRRAAYERVPRTSSQHYSQQHKTLVTTPIIKSDVVPRPSAGGGGAFQGGQMGTGVVEASAALDGGW